MSLEVVKAVLTGTPGMWDTERATALTDWQGELEDGLGRQGRGGVAWRSARAGRPGRPNDKEINKTQEDKSSNKNNQDHTTRQSKQRINNTKHNQQEQSNHTKNKNQQQNQYPAWNPDSRWSRRYRARKVTTIAHTAAGLGQVWYRVTGSTRVANVQVAYRVGVRR